MCSQTPRTSNPSLQSCRPSWVPLAGWSAQQHKQPSMHMQAKTSQGTALSAFPVCYCSVQKQQRSAALHYIAARLATHIQGTSNLVALWGVLQATVHVPAAPTQCSHAKGAPYVVQDSVWAGLSAVLWLWLLLHGAGMLLGSLLLVSEQSSVDSNNQGRERQEAGNAVEEADCNDLRWVRGGTEERKGPANGLV